MKEGEEEKKALAGRKELKERMKEGRGKQTGNREKGGEDEQVQKEGRRGGEKRLLLGGRSG
jgi:hypothetical protein